ncbi:anti-anti-sigma factor [Ornithinibacter aureus]|nr:anti-anti-sigma factor [Ornithinibacter aureus]
MEQRKPKGGGETVADRESSVVTITEYQDEHGWHVALRGRVDVRTAADLRLALHRLIAAGSTPLLLDLAEVHVGDATGFGLIVECQRRARRAGRQVHVVAADARTQRLLRRARLGSLLGPSLDCSVPERHTMAIAAS